MASSSSSYGPQSQGQGQSEGQGANFIESLWLSVFTPGPTSSLLLATNVSFAGLQVVLVLCFAATYSVHFVALSIISGGLWWAINWFANEVKLAQREEEAKKRAKEHITSGSEAEVEDSGVETETEQSRLGDMRSKPVVASSKAQPPVAATVETPSPHGAASGRSAGEGVEDSLRARSTRSSRKSMAESTGSLSTDSEWEKVDEESER